ncbi:LURP-one-related/scramblase family protein [Butyrivibrio fibrisolvens]|uniref:LURP-one-related/scramblase family protein n=1 Tax=Butyrivibrio fibrisolvens TaxID=831 RepID=UPI0003B6C677|nr:LURP-one-related family protein [Butyrivibrio fibrisolvens]
MGIFSKVHRYREAGQEANVNNVDHFGVPAKSLFTSTKVFTLHHKIDITDQHENIVYHTWTKFLSLHDKTDVFDAQDRKIAHIEKKFFSLHERHYITMDDGLSFELSNELFHIIKDITNINGLGWQLQGNILGLNFEIYDQSGAIIAVISQKMLSIHDKYCVDIYKPEYEKIIVAILVTLQHMIRDRQNTAAASSSSSSSSN